MKTKNRFGSELWKGLTVRMTLPRGGNVVSTIAKIETRGEFVRAYGKRVTLANGASGSVDDCAAVQEITPELVAEIENATLGKTFTFISGSVSVSVDPTWRKYASIPRNDVTQWHNTPREALARVFA